MGPFPHDAPPALVTADNPAGTDGFEFVEFAHPEPEKLEELFARMGYSKVATHRTKAISVWRQGDINYVINAEPGSPPIERMRRWFEDACPADKGALATFNAFRSDAEATSRIDYVWYTREQWELERYEVLHPRAGKRQASDHFPVLAHLRWLPQQQ